MSTERRLKIPGVVVLGFATLFLAAACSSGARNSLPPTESASPTSSATAAPQSMDNCRSATLSIDYAPFTTATLAGYGWDFVVAEVVGFEAARFNTPDGSPPPDFLGKPTPDSNPNAGTLIYTPINVMVETVISGPAQPGPSQFLVEGGTVPVEGGAVDCFTMSVSPTPQVEPGARYVFILSDELDGEGKMPLPLKKARFAWRFDAGGKVMTVDKLLTIDELTKIVQDATPSSEPQ